MKASQRLSIVDVLKYLCLVTILHTRPSGCLATTSTTYTTYTIKEFMRLPKVSVTGHPKTTASLISCARLCADSERCLSFYTDHDDLGHDIESWKCTLIPELLDEGKLEYAGTGFVGIESGLDLELQDETTTSFEGLMGVVEGMLGATQSETMTLPQVTTEMMTNFDETTQKEATTEIATDQTTTADTNSAPDMTLDPDNFVGYTVFYSSPAALYNCSFTYPNTSIASSTIGILYDNLEKQWPVFKNGCDTNLCQLVGMYGSYLTIKVVRGHNQEIAMTFAFPFCRFVDETLIEAASCDDSGDWKFRSPLKVGCMSSSCYRINPDGEAIYNGSTNTTENGVDCQRWDQQFPNDHTFNETMFPGDLENITAAANFCRDPNGQGRPWCYLASAGGGWDFCAVPVCQINTS